VGLGVPGGSDWVGAGETEAVSGTD
jgi:hypothetical protein